MRITSNANDFASGERFQIKYISKYNLNIQKNIEG